MALALPDLAGILRPPAAPNVVTSSSTSPYHLWVALETASPERFRVVLESAFWANRRVNVTRTGGEPSGGRAELRLNRLSRQTSQDADHGTIWIERRHELLSREFLSGERVGRYSLSYITGIDHD
jgi:hypothetical protein